MHHKPEHILSILDRCCSAFTFPMLDNGYVYLAATRLSLHRTEFDWALVIQVFGYSPRSGLPDTHIYTFASTLHNRNLPEKYVNRQAYDRYLLHNPHNESRFVFPISEGQWQDSSDREFVSSDASEVTVRGRSQTLPSWDKYRHWGIELERPPQIHVSELCRFLAEVGREQVLATPQERRISLLPAMNQVLQLEDWNHPHIVDGDLPSKSETFQQLAQILVTGDGGLYRPSQPPNTHWRNWPDGGSL